VRKEIVIYALIFVTVSIMADCRKSYAPPEINYNHLYLTVDGVINTSPESISSFKLTRSQKLSDTVPSIPERDATVFIKNGAGVSYPLIDTGSNGIYVSSALTLDPTQQYVLSITTSDGNQYASDPATPKQTPPIDSVTWILGFDSTANTQAIKIYLNTHDPSNNTRYYRWDFTETWTHESLFRSFYLVQNKQIVYVSDTTQHAWHCWTSAPSTNILLGSSSGLSTDIILQAPVTEIYQNDPRMDIKYSMLVRQYALDTSAYAYWLLVQKQSQSLGGLFDIIPSQLVGNMHNLTKPSEPVYGYVSASLVQQQRIFISNEDLPGWKSVPTQQCIQDVFTPDPAQGQRLYDYNNIDPNFTFFHYDVDNHGLPVQILITPACLDCTFQGGSTIKPPFWQ
jgi:Domain of unknown function (DUF4249)